MLQDCQGEKTNKFGWFMWMFLLFQAGIFRFQGFNWRKTCQLRLVGFDRPMIWRLTFYIQSYFVEKNSGKLSRWWQLKHFLFLPRSLGKWSNLTNIFQMGWNHQLVMVLKLLQLRLSTDWKGIFLTHQLVFGNSSIAALHNSVWKDTSQMRCSLWSSMVFAIHYRHHGYEN